MRGDIAAALVPLERALALAEPEGYVRIFVDDGPPMADMLERPRNAGSSRTTPVNSWPRSARLRTTRCSNRS